MAATPRQDVHGVGGIGCEEGEQFYKFCRWGGVDAVAPDKGAVVVEEKEARAGTMGNKKEGGE